MAIVLAIFIVIAMNVKVVVAANIRPEMGVTVRAFARPIIPVDTSVADSGIVVSLPAVVSRGRRRPRGAIYARFSSRFQRSITDQVRTCREWAEKNGVDVDDAHVFVDEAITGRTQHRPGLQALLKALAKDEVDVVITFATNRLYRKMYRSLQFVEEDILDKKKRVVFVAQGIDTDNTKLWRLLLQVFAILDELQVQAQSEFIRSAHIGLLLGQFIHGTISFGYCGRVVEGQITRTGKQRRKWDVDPARAEVVRKVFGWFVDEELGYHAIARRLNREGAAPPPRCRKGRWTALAVKLLLQNRRYIGDWSYGWKEAVWQNRQGYSRQFARETPRLEHRLEHLRIVEDAIFLRAAERGAKFKGRGGRRRKDQEGDVGPHLLKGLLWCPKHDQPLRVGGSHGHNLYCHACKQDAEGETELYSLVNRRLAERLIFGKLSELILTDNGLVAEVIAECQRQVESIQQPDPSVMADLKRRQQALTAQIAFIMDCPGDTETDRAENTKKIGQLRRQRTEVESELLQIENASNRQVEIPEDAAVRGMLQDIAGVLSRAAQGGDPADHAAARRIVILMTGGKLVMSQRGERKAQRGWLRATFIVNCLNPTVVQLGGSTPCGGQEVSIDLRDPTDAESLADRVKALEDQGLLVKQIAVALKTKRGLVAAARKHWYESHGLPVPDGRSRRSTLAVKHLTPPDYQQIADDVKQLADEGLEFGEIATRLGYDRNTITQSWAYWHNSRGLPVPDGRVRRKALRLAREAAVAAESVTGAEPGAQADSGEPDSTSPAAVVPAVPPTGAVVDTVASACPVEGIPEGRTAGIMTGGCTPGTGTAIGGDMAAGGYGIPVLNQPSPAGPVTDDPVSEPSAEPAAAKPAAGEGTNGQAAAAG